MVKSVQACCTMGFCLIVHARQHLQTSCITGCAQYNGVPALALFVCVSGHARGAACTCTWQHATAVAAIAPSARLDTIYPSAILSAQQCDNPQQRKIMNRCIGTKAPSMLDNVRCREPNTERFYNKTKADMSVQLGSDNQDRSAHELNHLLLYRTC